MTEAERVVYYNQFMDEPVSQDVRIVHAFNLESFRIPKLGHGYGEAYEKAEASQARRYPGVPEGTAAATG